MDREPLVNPDIDFTADVKARELRFEEVPETKVCFRGHPEFDSLSSTERKNLPEEVRRSVTYHNISVRLRIAAELADTEPNFGERAKEE